MIKRMITALALLLALLWIAPGALAADADTYYIDVDIANQITTVYRSADKSIVRQMICSTGKGDTTPRGTFRLQKTQQSTDRKAWYWIGNYSCYVKYATRIKGPYLFHSIPYTEKDMDKIDKEALAQLGSKASHGCIRLRWQDAKWIAMNCPDGTTVNIFSNAAKKEELRQLLLREGYSIDSGMTYEQYTASSYLADKSSTLGRGSKGYTVRLLQKRLLGLGFFTGKVNGTYDNATIVAVMRYQTAAGLAPTGIASKTLRKQIKAEKSVIGEYATLTPGCSGPLVSKLQQTLADLGFFKGTVDGKYGDDTTAALASYCACQGVEPVDSATPKLRSKLYAKLKKLNKRYGKGGFSLVILDEPVYSAVTKKELPLHKTASAGGKRLATVPKGTAVQVTSVGKKWCKVKYGSKTGYLYGRSLDITQSTATVAHWGATASAVGKAKMSEGSVGSGVKSLKKRLKALGFFTGDVNTLYDSAAVKAVKAYQDAAGLKQTGAASVKLQEAIFGSDEVTGTLVTLKQGSKGPAVKALQRTLKALQYYSGKCNGSYGSGTAKAVQRFTRSNGMKESKKASPAVQRAVLAQYLACEEKYGSGNYVLSISEVKTKVATVTGGTSLYKKKSAKSKVVAALAKGAQLEVLSKGKTWCKLETDGKKGYARTKYLSFSTVVSEVAEFNVPKIVPANALVYGDDPAPDADAAEEADAPDSLLIDGYEPVPEDTSDSVQAVSPGDAAASSLAEADAETDEPGE